MDNSNSPVFHLLREKRFPSGHTESPSKMRLLFGLKQRAFEKTMTGFDLSNILRNHRVFWVLVILKLWSNIRDMSIHTWSLWTGVIEKAISLVDSFFATHNQESSQITATQPILAHPDRTKILCCTWGCTKKHQTTWMHSSPHNHGSLQD